MLDIGIIGYGYWGPNLARNFSELDDARLVACCDLQPARLNLILKKYPDVAVTTRPSELIERSDLDAIVIATPVSTHYELAHEALTHGKHVLIEKPMTTTTEQADRLIELAARQKKTLMVDHTFVYTGAVRKMKEIISAGELGDLYYFDSVRVNLGLFQHDVNVIWDLAPHDISIMDYLIERQPVSVSATGACHIGNRIENIAYLTLWFEDNLIAHIHVNWLAPVKLRQTLIGGSRKMIVYDDTEPSEKIKVYDRGVTITEEPEKIYHTLIQYRTGDMYAPKLDQQEALQTECMHFIECISADATPITDGHAGRRVVAVLEAAQQSIDRQGRSIPLS